MMHMAAALALCVALAAGGIHVQAQGNEAGFESGWNGEAVLPPMGWRSWNAMGACIKSGLPGDGSNCTLPDGTPPLQPVPAGGANGGLGSRSGHHYCAHSCGSIASAVDAITARKWSVGGKTVSLADVGYASVGIDEVGARAFGWLQARAPAARG